MENKGVKPTPTQ